MCLQFLTDLDLRYCYIDNIESYPSSLINLDISHTTGSQLTTFTLKNLKQLTSLCLSESQVCKRLSELDDWPVFFQSHRSRIEKKIMARYCDIYTIQNGMFSDLPHLEQLDLYGNKLSNFHEVETCIFPFLRNLTRLILIRNSFTVIVPGQNFQQYTHKNGSMIDLINNPFECSCQNLQLFQLLTNKPTRIKNIEVEPYSCLKQNTNCSKTKCFLHEPCYSELQDYCWLQKILPSIVSASIAAVVSVLIALTIYTISAGCSSGSFTKCVMGGAHLTQKRTLTTRYCTTYTCPIILTSVTGLNTVYKCWKNTTLTTVTSGHTFSVNYLTPTGRMKIM
jgi:hypothetical protein